MNFLSLAQSIFCFETWKIFFLLIIYAVPLSRLITYPIEMDGARFLFINRIFGYFEHLVAPVRDTIIVALLAMSAGWNGYIGIYEKDWRCIAYILIAAFFIFLSFFFRSMKLKARLKLIDFTKSHPNIHPQEFIYRLLSASGLVRPRSSGGPYRTVDLCALDFRSGKNSRSIGVVNLIRGLLSTIWCTRLIMIAAKFCDRKNLKEVALSLGCVWGSRLIETASASFTIEDRELMPPAGSCIYSFTHGSFLDFAIAPLVLSVRQSGAKLPAFLAAKDHFKDNYLYYRVLGIGRAAEALGMIFIERAKGRDPFVNKGAMHKAAELIADGGDIILYPQGKRAHPRVSPANERLECAYYTVGSAGRIALDGAHLKKGVSYIATDAAKIISGRGSKGEIKIVPIAISGASIAAPRGSMRVKPNTQIKVRIGETIKVEARDASDEKSPDTLHFKIDQAMKNAARVHAELERRFFEDIRSILEPMQNEEVSVALKEWRGDDYLVHAVIDAIYSAEPKHWRRLLGELAHLLMNFATRDEILSFKGRIAAIL